MFGKQKSGALRALAVLAAGAVLALGGSAAAQAAPTIDGSELGSITFHKFEQPAAGVGEESAGVEMPGVTGTPLAGVTFTAQQVNPSTFDLRTNAGWTALQSLTPTLAAAGPFGFTGSGTTDAAGLTKISNLPVGVYLVTETSYPAGVTPSAPFLVTIPLTDPANRDNWVFDVHVYPKNAKTTAGQTVQDAAAQRLGDAVTWTITADIPDIAVIDGYKIVDALDSRLDYVSTAVALTNGTALVVNTDYTATHVASTNTVTVQFTAAGLLKLAANASAQVQVAIVTTVNEVGEIENEAIVYPNLPSFNILPGEPGGPIVTPPVETRWGNVTLHKVDRDDTATNLAGATFQVFPTRADAVALTNAFTIDGVSSWATDATGVVTISGLRYSGFANGIVVAPGAAGYQSYWIVKTVAPDGYSLLAEPIEVTVDSADVVVDLTVENVKHNGGFELPFTGGAASTWLFYVGGAAILAGAVVLIIRASQRARQQ